ncbi:MAG: dTDP-4-dehydrorhamnose reductase [Bacteroidetes bacterium]|nr:dTDP-4-dehydrorhamnose reductase [Bacteroidota bacterium]
MSKPEIIVTGATGQLGKEIQTLSSRFPIFDFVFLGRAGLPINDFSKAQELFKIHQPAFLINCAAYTAVDKAESEKETAFLVNADSVEILAALCKQYGTRFIHISTDYVFDGGSSTPLREDAPTGPISVYGASKLKGEELALKENPGSVIIRTSWVYSEFGNNFVKTMMRLMNERESINVVSDQIGSPTYAADLAEAIMQIINATQFVPGIYHYSNEGTISWYEFAVAIKEMINSSCIVNPIPTSQYPTPAKRPHYSLLDKTKISAVYALAIKDWKESLHVCISRLKNTY